MDGAIDEVERSAVAATTRMPDRSGNRKPGIEPAAYVEEPGFTKVSLDLAERESVFVVLRDAAAAQAGARVPSAAVETTLATIKGPWTLSFPPNWGAPASVEMPDLVSWTASSDPGVKYFSGTATYSKKIRSRPLMVPSGAAFFPGFG